MKTLLLSNSDGRFGGYAAAFRLLEGLKTFDGPASMLVAESTRNSRLVIGPNSRIEKELKLYSPLLDAFPLICYRKRQRVIFSPSWLPDNISKKVSLIKPDVINLHWVCGGFLKIETLRNLKRPLVWTFHDMWPFTGGCHYDSGCGRYKESCGFCPHLGSERKADLSSWIWRRKKKAWRNLKITIVTPSRWLARCAESSSLFRDDRIHVVPNGIDTKIYKPVDKQIARERLCLPKNKKLILFGAMNATGDKRKGFHLLKRALENVAGKGLNSKAELVIFGASEPSVSQEFGIKPNYMGQLNDDISLSLLYGAADVFVIPSVQDNLPNTVMESLACGTPVVAFNVGGIPDMVVHEMNGYLARPFEVDDLAFGIEWVLANDERQQRLSEEARKKVEKEFDVNLIAKRYLDLFAEILNNKMGRT